MKRLNIIFTWLVALVWLINGLYCKLLGYIPRHQQIVAEILGAEHAQLLTKLIGIGEILLAIWVISRLYPRTCAAIQISLVMTMNLIENIAVQSDLLWGKWNILFASIFCLFLWWKEFRYEPSLKP